MLRMTYAAKLAAALSGLALVWRALAGPLPFMHSPMNAESVFALSILILAVASGSQSRNETAAEAFDWKQQQDWWAPLTLIAIVAAAFAGSAHDYFLSDDFVMLRHAGEPSSPWMYTHGGGDGMFRPLIYESFRFLEPWAGHDPFRWHLSGLAIHAANSILVLLLARAIGFGRFESWFAAALFAVHATRPETAVWITGRFDLLSTFFVLAALVLFLGDHRWLALAAMIAGILSKESAYACPLLLLLLAPKRWKALVPFFAAAAALILYRFWLFGNIGGYKTDAGQLQALSVGVTGIAKALVLRLWAVLFFPVNWSVPPGPLLALAMFGFVLAMLWLFQKKAPLSRRAVYVAIAFTVLAALPPVQQLLIGADLQKARYLYLPSVGFCLLLAALVRRQFPIAALVLCFEMVALFHNLTAWHEASRQTQAYCQAAAAAAAGTADHPTKPPNSVNGVYFFQNGLTECIDLARPSK